MVNNEVVGNYQFPEKGDNISDDVAEGFERTIAIFNSNPQIIPCESIIEIGSVWDGKKFIPPVE